MWFWDAMASAGPNNLHLAPHSIFTGRLLFLTSNQQCQSTEGTVSSGTMSLKWFTADQ